MQCSAPQAIAARPSRPAATDGPDGGSCSAPCSEFSVLTGTTCTAVSLGLENFQRPQENPEREHYRSHTGAEQRPGGSDAPRTTHDDLHAPSISIALEPFGLCYYSADVYL